MKIVVCIKQVPDTTDIKWTENNTIQREGVESVMNPYDVWALEAALSIRKKRRNVFVTALSMGPNQAVSMLKKTVSLGADNAILISDKKFAGADTYATGKTIAKAIAEKLAGTDLVICGQFAVDGDTAQTGPSIASQLGLPQVTFVREIKEISDDYIVVEREVENGREIVEVQLPALICMLQSDAEPTRAKVAGIIKAQNFEVKQYGHEDLNLPPEEIGIKGSPTYVSRAFRPEKRQECVIVDSVEELAKMIGGENG